MCDGITQQIIAEVVQDMVARGASFTAFDVSLEAKRRGSRERHRHVKAFIHQCLAGGPLGGSYTRTLIAIPGAACPAWLYHPLGASPAGFQPLARPGSQGQPACGFEADRRSRICVPARLLRQAGLRPGDRARVLLDPRDHSLKLARDQARHNQRELTTYRVDGSGNVRIGPRTLRQAALGGQPLALEGDAKKVIIRLADLGAGPN